MPSEYWALYLEELDKRISAMVVLRDKIRALIEVEDILGAEAAELALQDLKQKVLTEVNDAKDADARIANTLSAKGKP